MGTSGQGRTTLTWWSLLLCIALGALVLAAPAAAGQRQDANISQSCTAGDSDDDSSDSDDSDDDSSSSNSGGGDCGNQRRVVQQSGGGSVSRSINQSQSFGDDNDDDDGERARARRDRDRDEDDFEEEQSASVSDEELSCGDFENQADAQAALEDDSGGSSGLDEDDDGRACEEDFTQAVSGAPEGGVETGGGGTLARSAGGSPAAVPTAVKIAGPPLALALLVGGLFGLRRARTA